MPFTVAAKILVKDGERPRLRVLTESDDARYARPRAVMHPAGGRIVVNMSRRLVVER
jgi:hypothetical protein